MPLFVTDRTWQVQLGLISGMIALTGILMVVLNWTTRIEGGRDISGILIIAIPLLLLSVLSLCRVYPATFAIALLFFIFGIFLLVGSLRGVPFPWLIINVSLGLVMMYPLVALIRVWLRKKVEKAVEKGHASRTPTP